jgi:hypothetical protein
MSYTTEPINKVASRIESQTESLKGAADRISRLTATNVLHARQLGFFEPPKDAGQAPSPVVTTLEDAINQIHREIDSLEGSMNLFN